MKTNPNLTLIRMHAQTQTQTWQLESKESSVIPFWSHTLIRTNKHILNESHDDVQYRISGRSLQIEWLRICCHKCDIYIHVWESACLRVYFVLHVMLIAFHRGISIKWYWKSRSFTWLTNLKNTKHCEENNRASYKLSLSLALTHTHIPNHARTYTQPAQRFTFEMKERAWMFCIRTMVPILTDLYGKLYGWKYSKDFLRLDKQFVNFHSHAARDVNWFISALNETTLVNFLPLVFVLFYFNLYINILA